MSNFFDIDLTIQPRLTFFRSLKTQKIMAFAVILFIKHNTCHLVLPDIPGDEMISTSTTTAE